MARTPGIDRTESLSTCKQALVVLADHLGQEVEGAGAHDDVIDLGQSGELVGHHPHVAFDGEPDHGLAGEAELERIGHGDDLHDPGLAQPLHPAPHGRLGQAHRLGDGPVGLSPVALERLDNGPVCLIEKGSCYGSPLALSVGRFRRVVHVGHATPHSNGGRRALLFPQRCLILS